MSDSFAASVRAYGLTSAFYRAVAWRARQQVGYRSMTIVTIRLGDLKRDDYLAGLPDYTSGFVSVSQLRLLARSRQGPGQAFVERAIARGDRCYGIFDGPELASYGWYSSIPTPIDDDMTLDFGSGLIYVYKGFTAPEYRGQRLHGIGMSRALAEFDAEGYRGLVSFVDSDNHASLRSCGRMGYRIAGTVRVLRPFGSRIAMRSRGCRDLEVRIEWRRRPTLAEVPNEIVADTQRTSARLRRAG